MKEIIKNIKKEGEFIAMIIRNSSERDGSGFYTPNDLSQQVAVMKHPAGKEIEAHSHKANKREVHHTQEVLIICKGELRIDLYDKNMVYFESYIAKEGDIILLASGGHGFKVLKDLEMIEVKQGPFIPESDKIRFAGVGLKEINIKEL